MADGILVLGAVLAGSIVGKLHDPLAWALIALVAAVGWLRAPWWSIVIAAALATAINIAFVYSWWAELGIAHTWVPRTVRLLIVHLVLATAAYWLGRLLARINPAEASR